MNLQEYCNALNIGLDLNYHPNQKGRWTASFPGSSIKEGQVLKSVYGEGTAPAEAMQNLVSNITGKILVIHGSNDQQNEYVVPQIFVLE